MWEVKVAKRPNYGGTTYNSLRGTGSKLCLGLPGLCSFSVLMTHGVIAEQMMGGVPQLRAADVFVKPNPTRPLANVEPSTGQIPGRRLSTPPTKGDGALRGGGSCRTSRGVDGVPKSAR